jgi:hypothetical protein
MTNVVLTLSGYIRVLVNVSTQSSRDMQYGNHGMLTST